MHYTSTHPDLTCWLVFLPPPPPSSISTSSSSLAESSSIFGRLSLPAVNAQPRASENKTKKNDENLKVVDWEQLVQLENLYFPSVKLCDCIPALQRGCVIVAAGAIYIHELKKEEKKSIMT